MIQYIVASHPVGRIMGIEVRLTYILYAAVALVSLSAFFSGGISAGLLVFLEMLLLCGFVLAHELGHCVSAIKEGMRVRSISLHPLGGLASLEGQCSPLSELQTAIAGPTVNLFLGAICYLIMLLARGSWISDIAFFCFDINMMLALFNLLPVFPMDGGRVLLAALTIKRGPERAVFICGKVARVGLILMAVVGFWLMMAGSTQTGFLLLAIALCFHLQGRQELHARAAMSSYSAYGSTGYGNSYPEYQDQPREEANSGWFAGWKQRLKQRREQTAAKAEQDNSQKVDEILRKVNREGIAALTDSERKTLLNASKILRK